MALLLDTNIVIHVMDGDDWALARLAEVHEPILVSILTRVELEGGAARDPHEAQMRRGRLDLMLANFSIIPFDNACADAYRRLIDGVGYSRRQIVDRMIAAQALAYDAPLVTRNFKDFRDVPGLTVVQW